MLFSPGVAPPTGRAGRFVRRNGLIMEAAARNLRHCDYAAPALHPAGSEPNPEDTRSASADRVKKPNRRDWFRR